MKKLFILSMLGASAFTTNAQWTSNTMVNTQVSNLSVSDMKAVNTPDGKTWVAYYTSRVGSASLRFDMYAQLLDTAGNKLLGPNGVLVDSNSSGSATYVFNVCANGKNDLVIGMQDQRAGAGTSTTVAYKITQTGTSAWNGAAGVVLGGGYSPYATLLNSGDVVFSWLENSGKLNYQKISDNGTIAWTTPKAMIQNSRRGQMAPTSDSGFVMVYQSPLGVVNSTLYAQRFTKNGDSVWANSVQLCNETTSSARYYSILNDGDTTYFGYYSSLITNHFDAFVQRINPDGTIPYGINGASVSDYSLNSDPNEQLTNIALQPNSPYIWAVTTFGVTSPQQQSGVMVQKFVKSNGQRQFNTLGKVVYPMTATMYGQQGGLTFKKNHPVFMIASSASYVIRATVLNDTGDFLLPAVDFELSGTTITQPSSLTKGRYAFTNMIDNQSVAVWYENRDTMYRAYAQNFRLDNLDTSLSVATVNNVAAVINTYHGTLPMMATLLPSTASQNVTWSIVPGTGAATISTAGVVTASADGTVWAKATSTISSAYVDSMQITITNQADTTTPSGISEIEKTIGFSAFPNPATDVLNLHITVSHPALVIRIIDMNGRVLFSEKTAPNALNNNKSIHLKSFAAGNYMLQVNGEGININKQFSKN